MSLFFIYLFIICWTLGIVFGIRMAIIGSKLKGIIQTNYRHIRFVFGFSTRGIPPPKLASGSISMIGMLFTAGSKQSVLSWLDAFMDVDAISTLPNPSVKKYFNQLVLSIGIWVKALIGGFVCIGLAGVV